MKKTLLFSVAVVLALASASLLIPRDQSPSDEPRYTSDGRMLRPDNYREWTWLSSGLGMSYSPQAAMAMAPSFDNVFVNPAAYRSFVRTGTWPDKTTFVLEVRASETNGSINRSGHFQTKLLGLDLHVKDESRFKGNWAFFNFDSRAASAPMIPISADCYSCHQQHGAVDTTFVQFYPTLLEVAQQKKTLTKY